MNDMFFALVLCMEIASACLLAGKLLIHYFQLESYQFPGYFRTIRRNLFKSVLPGFSLCILLIAAVLLAAGVFHLQGWLLLVFAGVILIPGGYLIGRLFSEKKAKKALAYTPRIKRFYCVSFIVFTLILFLLAQSVHSDDILNTQNRISTAAILFFPMLLPIWIAVGGLLAWPVEKAISEMYFRDAQRILRERNDLIRIGITGSWGKTSVKFILGTILEEKYHTLVTPASFNTPMGVTKVIRTRLEPSHRVFIAEMGARHVGDIKEMCRLVHPQKGVITSVGPQHLDTFKTTERVAKTKFELIESLPADGSAYFADDQDICRQLYQKTSVHKVISGLDSQYDDVWAEDITFSPEGCSFLLCREGERIHCHTQLLGELNIRNILLSASVAMEMGLSLAQTARGISRIKPIEHRLQLIRHPGGIAVIDDAFNSNIQGAKQAFQVLKQFPQNRIIVTPGMVELGEKEYDMNRQFGEAMADCCDIAILVGKKRSEAIIEGLKNKGVSSDSVLVVANLDEATVKLREIGAPGDTVLFENDLPDNYTEA